jgi:hypothetical protein
MLGAREDHNAMNTVKPSILSQVGAKRAEGSRKDDEESNWNDAVSGSSLETSHEQVFRTKTLIRIYLR